MINISFILLLEMLNIFSQAIYMRNIQLSIPISTFTSSALTLLPNGNTALDLSSILSGQANGQEEPVPLKLP